MRRTTAIITGTIAALVGSIIATGPISAAEHEPARTINVDKVVVGEAPEGSAGFVVGVDCAEFSGGGPGGHRPAMSWDLPFLADGSPDPAAGTDVTTDWSIVEGMWQYATTDLSPHDCTAIESGTGGAERVAYACTYTPAAVADQQEWTACDLTVADEVARVQMPFGPFTETDECDVPADACFDSATLTIVNDFTTFERLFGANRYETSVAVSEMYFPAGAPVVYIATGEQFADALAAGVHAGLAGGPVLLVRPNSVPAAVLAEIQRLGPDTIIIAGGPAAISDDVADELADEAMDVHRVFGSDRYATAAALSAAGFPAGAGTVYVANGQNFPDALAGVPLAGVEEGPLLLVGPTSLPQATADEIERLAPDRIVILGGGSAVSDDVFDDLAELATEVVRFFGANRYGTAVALSEEFFELGAATVFLASGADFPDALSAGPVAIQRDAPVLLSRPNCVPEIVLDEIERLAPGEIILVGGEAALSAEVEALEACPA